MVASELYNYTLYLIYTLDLSNKHLIPNNLGIVVTPSHVHVVYHYI